MNVAIVRPGELPRGRFDLAVVIDVLRATTTATVLCDRLGELCIVRTPQELGELPPRTPGYTLFSELTDFVAELPRFDNSPVIARDAELDGRTPVLVTTNGTLAIGHAAEIADEVLLASFVNLGAVIGYIQARNPTTVAVMPAGNIKKNQATIEDDGCANAILSRLSRTELDVASVIAACHVDPRIVRRRTNEPGLAADIDLCLALDRVPVVPCVTRIPAQRWFTIASASRT